MTKIESIQFAFVVSAVVATSLLVGCSRNVPSAYDETDVLPAIYPDYVETTFPPNIAPANFMIEEDAEAYIVKLSGSDGSMICVSGQKAIFPEKKDRRKMAQTKKI